MTSPEGWSPGSLNLAQAIATKLRTLLAHGDITQLLVDFSRHPDDPERFSRFSKTLSEDQRHKLDERHHRAHLNLLKQRIIAEQRLNRVALHLSIRTTDRPGMPAIELLHSNQREIESKFVARWLAALRAIAPDVDAASRQDSQYGLSRFLRDELPQGFGSVSVVATRSSFLEGKPIRWDRLKKMILETLPLS